MSQNTERGARSERGSALWGTGSRGGDRSSVLWGKGGRGILVSCVAAFALAAPMAAMADSGKGPSGKSGAIASSFIAPSLLNATGKVDVIIQSSKRHVRRRVEDEGSRRLPEGHEAARPDRRRRGGRAGLPAEEAGGRVRPHRDAEREREAGRCRQVEPAVAVRVRQRRALGRRRDDCTPASCRRSPSSTPASRSRADFGNRVIASVNLSTIPGNTSLDDQRGHGTFVAGIAAGAAPDLRRRCSWSTARLGQGDERPGPGEDVRRHHGGPVDPGQQGRSTTSALPTSRCTRATARTSIVTRSIRQSRSSGSTASSLSRHRATTARRPAPRACSTRRATTRS